MAEANHDTAEEYRQTVFNQFIKNFNRKSFKVQRASKMPLVATFSKLIVILLKELCAHSKPYDFEIIDCVGAGG